MPTRLPPAAILLLLACQGGEEVRSDHVRDLTAALEQHPSKPDTAVQRADSQFQTCLYVYDSAEKLRECLVIHNGWNAEKAERRIAIWRAEVQRVLDSAAREEAKADAVVRRRADSVARIRAAAQAVRDAVAARKRRQDSVFAATKPYWGSKHDRLFYANVPGCQGMYLIAPEDRRFFESREEAESAGYQRVTRADC